MYTNRRPDPLKKQIEQPSEVTLFNSGTRESWVEKMKIRFNRNQGSTVTDLMVEKGTFKLHKSYLHISSKYLSGTRKSLPSDQMSWHFTPMS